MFITSQGYLQIILIC